MSCPAMTFESITPERYNALIQTAQAQGLNITGLTGSTHYQGMDFTWNYDSAAESLTILCTDKPFFVPCSMIEEQIRKLVV